MIQMQNQIPYQEVEECRVCGGTDFTPYLDLGEMPLVNRLLTDPNDPDPKFPLEVLYCNDCSNSQLSVVVDPSILFRDYVYRSSMSQTYMDHCARMARLSERELDMSEGDLVVDIASNDGALLQQFKPYNVRVLGIDPATNLAKIATEEGIPTIAEFWPGDLPERIIEEYGPAKIITATNVFAHVGDIQGFARGVYDLLDEEGTFMVEFPYMVDLIQNGCFDTIYHEHLSYFLVSPLVELFRRVGLDIARVDRLPIHGGSVRLYVRKDGSIETSVEENLLMEEEMGYHDISRYLGFAEKTDEVREDLLDLLEQKQTRGESVAAFGAAAKGTILLNYCDIGPEIIPYIVDDTPEKQGKYIPGMHIPVVSRDRLTRSIPDNLLILPWNFLTEILSNTASFRSTGGSYIAAIPRVRVIKPERIKTDRVPVAQI